MLQPTVIACDGWSAPAPKRKAEEAVTGASCSVEAAAATITTSQDQDDRGKRRKTAAVTPPASPFCEFEWVEGPVARHVLDAILHHEASSGRQRIGSLQGNMVKNWLAKHILQNDATFLEKQMQNNSFGATVSMSASATARIRSKNKWPDVQFVF